MNGRKSERANKLNSPSGRNQSSGAGGPLAGNLAAEDGLATVEKPESSLPVGGPCE